MLYHNKYNVLFLECGLSGQGGSFRSLKEHIEIMRNTLDKVVIVLVNDSVFKQDYLNLGCEVIQLKHPIYSQDSIFLQIYNKVFSLCKRISSKLTLYFQLMVERHFSNKLVQLIKKHHIDLIHLNNQPMRNFSGFMAAKRTNSMVVSHIRTLHTFGFSDSFYGFIHLTQPRFIAISHAVCRAWQPFGVESEVIYNPVPVPAVNSKNIDKEYDVIYVGRLEKDKGVEDLLYSISTLPLVTLAILGDGSLKKYLMNLSKSLHMDDRVFFLGYHTTPLKFISMARVLVVPSKNEGMSRVLIEAMKLKVPVIANQVGGMVELVEHKVTGLLYDAEEKKALRKSIALLLTDHALYTKIQQGAYFFSTTQFIEESYFNKMTMKYSFS